MTVAFADEVRAAEFPPGVNVAAVLRPLRTPTWELSSEYRRAITKASPILFALTYLGPNLQHQDTGLISFSRLHLDMCSAARRWVKPGAYRDAWIAPRKGGKTLWAFHALPLWALAHGHRKFMMAFAMNDTQAKGHLANILDDLRRNELLLHDFPELKIRRGTAGADRTVLESGATLAARGMGATSLGVRSGSARPDILVGDDLEKGEVDNSLAEVEKNRSRLLRNIIPMNATGGAVQVAGTVTMYGSLIHEFVNAAKGRSGAEWVAANRFTPRYYGPFEPDGSSLWPQQWSQEWLEEEQTSDPQGFSLNYDNDPLPDSELTFWTRDLFQYDSRFPIVARVLHVDVAVSTNPNSDYTALALVGRDSSGRRALVERVEWGKWTAPEIREQIHAICEPLRVKPLVRVESNQGGDTWLDSLAPWPVDVKYETCKAGRASKTDRIKWAHAHYHRRAVWHPQKLRAEAELLRWHPRVAHDDVPDAISGALEWAFPVVRK